MLTDFDNVAKKDASQANVVNKDFVSVWSPVNSDCEVESTIQGFPAYFLLLFIQMFFSCYVKTSAVRRTFGIVACNFNSDLSQLSLSKGLNLKFKTSCIWKIETVHFVWEKGNH